MVLNMILSTCLFIYMFYFCGSTLHLLNFTSNCLVMQWSIGWRINGPLISLIGLAAWSLIILLSRTGFKVWMKNWKCMGEIPTKYFDGFEFCFIWKRWQVVTYTSSWNTRVGSNFQSDLGNFLVQCEQSIGWRLYRPCYLMSAFCRPVLD